MSRFNYALIGNPLGHSMSPFIHKQLFSLSGHDADYRLIQVEPEKLKDVYFSELVKLNGFNVTIPYKEKIIAMLDSTSQTAQFYGAVNCVSHAGQSVGYNTDAYGFVSSLKATGLSLKGKVLVLGNGGAARCVAFEAARMGCNVTIASRSDKGSLLSKEIARRLGCEIEVLRFSQISGGFDLVINATPVGMYPNCDQSPLEKEQLENCAALFDLIYNPCRTKLMKYADELGMKVCGGMPMLVWQAVRSHEIWYSASFNQEDIANTILLADAHLQTGGFGGAK